MEGQRLKNDILNILGADENAKIAYMIENRVNPYEPHMIYHQSGINKHRSVWRAMRRGNVSVDGSVFPRRPYNNRKPTKGRKQQIIARNIYEQFTAYIRREKENIQ